MEILTQLKQNTSIPLMVKELNIILWCKTAAAYDFTVGEGALTLSGDLLPELLRSFSQVNESCKPASHNISTVQPSNSIQFK
jgi:hypothetical protein